MSLIRKKSMFLICRVKMCQNPSYKVKKFQFQGKKVSKCVQKLV